MKALEIRKILIANRGEIAVRIIRACREMDIKSVVVFSGPDQSGLPARMADEAYLIGPAPARHSYLRQNKILEIARKSRADAIHPGDFKDILEGFDDEQSALDSF